MKSAADHWLQNLPEIALAWQKAGVRQDGGQMEIALQLQFLLEYFPPQGLPVGDLYWNATASQYSYWISLGFDK